METTAAQREIRTVSFKEVHEELEKEHIFLKQNHDVNGFREKADFLKDVGFNNSIATKLYGAIAKNSHLVGDYERRYLGMYKFILEPQLERVCEKYNLFVREPRYFLGDIPDKNIKDIMNFKVFVSDIITEDKFMGPYFLKSIEQYIEPNYDSHNPIFQGKISIKDLSKITNTPIIEIAAVKDLFDKEAFKTSNARILDKTELSNLFQVDLDPIVLCKTIHGRIIVTAWGDEANDELVANQKFN